MRIKLVTAPTSEPLTVEELQEHLRIDQDTDRDFVAALITAARDYVEKASRRALMPQTWRLNLDGWPCNDEIELPKPPLSAVTSVVYKDTVGAQTTLSTAAYVVDTDSEPGRIVLAYGESWPNGTLYPANPILITYVAGYTDADAVPAWTKQAIRLIVGHWYENREETISGTTMKPIPLGAESLIWMNRAY